MLDKSLFGITAQPVKVFSNADENTYVICKHDTEKLEYWDRSNRKWVDSIFNATLWPKDKEGQIPYLANNVYSLFEGFTAKNYKLVGISQGLYPCTIKYIGTNLYLKQITELSPGWCVDSDKIATDWTDRWEDCLWISGPYKALDIMWNLIYSK